MEDGRSQYIRIHTDALHLYAFVSLMGLCFLVISFNVIRLIIGHFREKYIRAQSLIPVIIRNTMHQKALVTGKNKVFFFYLNAQIMFEELF